MTTTTQHTPGPWYSQPTAGHETHGQSAIASEATGKTVAIAYDGQTGARLIAAAPDLLAALETCVSELNQLAFLAKDKLAKAAIEKGIEALRKAKGGQQ
jgi:hypothetical protein